MGLFGTDITSTTTVSSAVSDTDTLADTSADIVGGSDIGIQADGPVSVTLGDLGAITAASTIATSALEASKFATGAAIDTAQKAIGIAGDALEDSEQTETDKIVQALIIIGVIFAVVKFGPQLIKAIK
jgi:hypothetical protein